MPKLTLSKRQGRSPSKHDPNKECLFRYRAKRHSSLPHVVKFSGGRSSGMLLFILLENGLLDAARGDVIVFNNTSAEHPHTYGFVRDCMRTAHSYGIPYFQLEFQTYEDVRQGEWTRLPTYRLVNDRPKSTSNDDGFHWRGEAFEELLSWAGYVPNQFSRICTKHLKLDAARNFLKDRLAPKATIPRLGHYGGGSRIDPDVACERHRKNHGRVPEDIFLRKRAYVWSRPHMPRSSDCRDTPKLASANATIRVTEPPASTASETTALHNSDVKSWPELDGHLSAVNLEVGSTPLRPCACQTARS